MTDVLYDFENFATDPDAVVPPELNPSGMFGSQGVLAFPTSAFEPIFGPAPDPTGNGNIVGLSMHATNPGEAVSIRYDGNFPTGGQVEFDWATHGTPGDVHQVKVDGTVEFDETDAFDVYTHPVVTLAPGAHAIEISMVRGDGEALVDDYGNGMILDNLAFQGVELPDPPAGPGYARGKIVRHNGGLYLSLTENVVTEPGPGDSDDWLELRVQSVP